MCTWYPLVDYRLYLTLFSIYIRFAYLLNENLILSENLHKLYINYTPTHTLTCIYTHTYIYTHIYIHISECSAICCYSELSHVLHFENINQKPKSNKKTKIGKKGKGKNKDEIYIEIAFFIFSLSLKGSTYCIYIYQIYIYMK